MSASRIHPTAIVERGVELGARVEVGPYCVLQAGVRIGDDTRLHSHVVITGRTTIGAHNVFFPFSVIGGEAQLSKKTEEGTGKAPKLEIGDANVFREHVTVNVGSWDQATRIGSTNLFMAGSHVAHDVVVGSHCVVANGVQLAGHVVVGDYVTFGGLSGCAQYVRVGESAFVAGGAMCERDVPAFVIVQGDRARVRALNKVGLARRRVPDESVRRLVAAFRAVFVGGVTRQEAIASLDRDDPWVDRFVAGLAVSPCR